jgi:hypothetical protein
LIGGIDAVDADKVREQLDDGCLHAAGG